MNDTVFASLSMLTLSYCLSLYECIYTYIRIYIPMACFRESFGCCWNKGNRTQQPLPYTSRLSYVLGLADGHSSSIDSHDRELLAGCYSIQIVWNRTTMKHLSWKKSTRAKDWFTLWQVCKSCYVAAIKVRLACTHATFIVATASLNCG